MCFSVRQQWFFFSGENKTSSLCLCDDCSCTTHLSQYIAAFKGHDTTVRLLVQLGSSPNARNNHGDTPVLIAAREAHDSTIRLLVSELGASCNPVNNSGITPVAIAAYNGHESTV
jgi:ankyrin repeat protein